MTIDLPAASAPMGIPSSGHGAAARSAARTARRIPLGTLALQIQLAEIDDRGEPEAELRLRALPCLRIEPVVPDGDAPIGLVRRREQSRSQHGSGSETLQDQS